MPGVLHCTCTCATLVNRRLLKPCLQNRRSGFYLRMYIIIIIIIIIEALRQTCRKANSI